MKPIPVIVDQRKIAEAVIAAGRRVMARTVVAAEPQISELVTVKNVPMISTGIDYPTSTGNFTFTEQHLADLVMSQDDPAIHAPRTKIGHSDPRFNGRVAPSGEVLDGEPSLATWTNLRLSEDKQTVIGDMVGVPRWFAQIMATAYPSRSVEGNFDVETVTGHKWSLAIESVALLGVIGPGITTLDDLPQFFSEDGPEVTVEEPEAGEPGSVIHSSTEPTIVSSSNQIVAETVSSKSWSQFKDSDYDDAQYAAACVYDRAKCSDDWKSKPAKQRYSLRVREPDGTLNKNGVHAAASRFGSVGDGCDAAAKAAATTLVNLYKNQLKEDPPDNLTTAANASVSLACATPGVQAQAQVDDVRRQFYDGLEAGQFWWWIRAIYLDPNELIVDDDDGGLYRVPFTVGEEGDIEFSDPVPVKIQYVDQPTPAAQAAIRASVASSLHDEPQTTYQVRAESRPGGTMDPARIRAIRAALGLTEEQLPDTADDATVTRVLSTAELNAAAPSGATPAGQGETPPAGEQHENEPTTPPSQYPEGTSGQPIANATGEAQVPGARPLQLPEGTIVVDRETWETVARQASEGAALAASTRDQERDRFLNDAIKAGKFPPSRRQHYLDAWTADAEGTRGLIDSLQPGLVPVEARGTATAPNEQERIAAEGTYDQSWLTPAERSRVERAAKQDGTALVVQGGD